MAKKTLYIKAFMSPPIMHVSLAVTWLPSVSGAKLLVVSVKATCELIEN